MHFPPWYLPHWGNQLQFFPLCCLFLLHQIFLLSMGPSLTLLNSKECISNWCNLSSDEIFNCGLDNSLRWDEKMLRNIIHYIVILPGVLIQRRFACTPLACCFKIFLCHFRTFTSNRTPCTAQGIIVDDKQRYLEWAWTHNLQLVAPHGVNSGQLIWLRWR